MSSLVHSHPHEISSYCLPIYSPFSFLFTCICFIYLSTNLLCSFVTDGKGFILNLRVVHVRDLNFVLRSEIFIHTDGQLWASHLILDCKPVYRTWQPFSQDILLDSPLLSYIDMRHVNFLPPKLTSSEAQDISSRYTTADDLASVRDKSAKCVSRSCQQHFPVEELVDLVLLTKQKTTEVKLDAEMVTRRKMTIGWFLPNTNPPTESQQPQGKGWSLPPPSSSHAKKK